MCNLHVKATKRAKVRTSLIKTILLCAQRKAKALETENVLYAPHIVTVRYPITRKSIATSVAPVAPRILVIARCAVAGFLALPTAENRECPEIEPVNSVGPIELLVANIAGDDRCRIDFTRRFAF